MKLALVLASVVALAAGGSVPAHKAAPHAQVAPRAALPAWDKPSFCRTNDCPEFTVVSSTKDYEERRYIESRWVQTSSMSMEDRPARTANFQRLFRYIDGNNVRDEKVAMTSPVLVRILPGAGPACETNFTSSFFVAESDANPPAPRDDTVSLGGMPEMTVYVGSFAGFADTEKWLEAAIKLRDALPDSASYHTDFWYTASYDSPFVIFNRHNEVWFMKK